MRFWRLITWGEIDESTQFLIKLIALIQSEIDSATIFKKFQNRATRVITGSTYDIRSIDVLDQLGWETLEQKRNYLISHPILLCPILSHHIVL